jgi:hypothetical protein
MDDVAIKVRSLQLLAVLVALLVSSSAFSRAARLHLFSIERNTNANLLHYALNLNEQGKPMKNDPISAQWQMLAEDGHREELTWLERNFAYGWRLLSKVTPRGFTLRLAAWDGRTIAVEPDPKHRFVARVTIDQRPAVLNKIYVEAEETATLPRVKSVTLYGTELGTGRKIRERIVP